jgi:polysaccharide biosynthesis protein PslH
MLISHNSKTQEASYNHTRPPLHVVIVDEELPYPPNSGKRIRSLNLIMRLARSHRLTYIAHRNADPNETSKAEAYFYAHGIEVLLADRQVPPKLGIGFYARLAANIFSSLPYSVQIHTSKALQQIIRDYQAAHKVNLWHCEWTPYAENLQQAIPHQPFVVMAHNIESQIWQRYTVHERNPLKRWYIQRQATKFEHFEQRVFSLSDTTVTVSHADAAMAQQHFGAKQVEVLENGVDLDYFHPVDLEREAGSILFLGSLDWRPNIDAILLLLEKVFPHIIAHDPAAKLWLVGRHPPRQLVDRVRQERNVELYENVPDVRPYLWHCSTMVVPLRIGGGSRLKILEALACACPVISTGVGAEGLELIPGKHYLLANTPEEMIKSILKCLSVPSITKAMAQCGREAILQDYNWDTLSIKLEKIWYRHIGRQAMMAVV